MRVVLSVLLLLSGQTFLLGLLSPPQNVMLTSENFHIFLVWKPGPGSGNDTQYEIESRKRNSDWTREDTCWRNITQSSHKCKLYFEDEYKMYWARVRAVNGALVSEWALSNELQPYRDSKDLGDPRGGRQIIAVTVFRDSPPVFGFLEELDRDHILVSHGQFIDCPMMDPVTQCQLALKTAILMRKGLSLFRSYRDKAAIVGPPKLNLLLVNGTLTVKLSMPLTPYRRRNGTYKSVQKVLLKLQYLLSLSEEGVEINSVLCDPKSKITWHRFEYLKTNTNYCVTASIHGQQSKVSLQCIKTPDGPVDFIWALVAALTALLVLLLLSVGGFYFLKLYLYPSTSKIHFPKTLTILNEELNANLWNKSLTQDLEGATINLISVTGPAIRGSSAIEQERLQIQFLPKGGTDWTEEGYCANGFGPGSSSSLGQLEFAGTANSEALLSLSRQMKDGYAGEKDYRTALEAQHPLGQWVLPEQLLPVSIGLAKAGHMGKRGFQTCLETEVPLQLQVYSEHSSPVSETSSLPPHPSGAKFSLRDLKENTEGESTEWPPMFWVNVRLSSVKLPAYEETEDHLAPSSTCLYSHTSNKTMKDSKVDLVRLGQSNVKQQEYLPVSQEQHGLPECTEFSDNPAGELYPKADDSKIMAFSSYELCPQCLYCS